jgi:hypothetical protein
MNVSYDRSFEIAAAWRIIAAFHPPSALGAKQAERKRAGLDRTALGPAQLDSTG